MNFDQYTEGLPVWAAMGLKVLAAIGIFIIGWMVSKWTYRLVVGLIRKRNLDEALGRFGASIAQYTVLAAAVIAALGAVGIETTSLVAIFASAGLAIGLALQGSLSNFAAGVMILIFRPFDLGDVVIAAGETGKVEDIGMFASTFSTPDNKKIIIGNSAIIGSNITNLTTLGTRGLGVAIGVGYGTDLAEANRVILEAVKSADMVLAEPAPSVVCTGFGASSVDFLAKFCVTAADFTANGGQQAPHNVRIAIYDALNAAGIEIPFDQVVMHQAPAADANEDAAAS